MRKIIHVDMDCFYAAVEIRDDPSLADKPVAVGGPSNKRGVICTCNYIARRFGIHSAMATMTAYKRCKELVVLPVNMAKYKMVAKNIHAIFREYTSIVEPLALDEAYLDVTGSSHHQGSATWIAEDIRQQIWQRERLTASAGVAPNKFLAKVASGWNKPNGLFVIPPQFVTEFTLALPIEELFGVGKVTAQKLHHMQIKTCADLQMLSLLDLTQHFGKLGQHLYGQCRGIDERPVIANRQRKSLSVEQTFSEDRANVTACIDMVNTLYEQLLNRLETLTPKRGVKSQFIKLKMSDFRQKTAESAGSEISFEQYLVLLHRCYGTEQQAIRLLGLGVHFKLSSAC
ncbi:DNA polymerase IV [soil metagenome]